MAVIYQSKGSKSEDPHVVSDARFDIDRTTNPAISHRKSNFFHKHLRIMDPLPSRAEMETIVQNILGDRKKRPDRLVVNALGEKRTKGDTYGTDTKTRALNQASRSDRVSADPSDRANCARAKTSSP